MRTDTPQAIQGALGLIEDAMAEFLPSYADAAGEVAKFELWRRIEYLKIRDELKPSFPAGYTETAKKDDVDAELMRRHADVFERIQIDMRTKGRGDKLFAGLDARRSIGQTLLKPHLAMIDPQHGQEARGQHGTVAR